MTKKYTGYDDDNQHLELADDEILAVMNGIIKVSDVKIAPLPFEAEGEAGLMYRATLKAEIDTDGILDWFKCDDKAAIIQQNDSLQDAIQRNDELSASLTEQYNRATSQAERDRIRKQMEQGDRDFWHSRNSKKRATKISSP